MRAVLTKSVLAGALGLASLGFGSSAFAAVIQTPDGPRSPFGGFDWNPAGQAVSTGVIGGDIQSTYWGNAVGVYDTGQQTFALPNLVPPTGGTYEYTLLANISETSVCINPVPGGCLSANFFATGGTYTIYFDTTADADLVTGAGITDGVPIITGSIIPGFAGNFTATGGPPPTGGAGVFTFNGTVDFTDTTYINPALLASISTFTLQFGSTAGPSFIFASNLPGAGGASGGLIPEGALQFRADGNTDFTSRAIPEPGSLTLAGLGILLAGFGLRSRKK